MSYGAGLAKHISSIGDIAAVLGLLAAAVGLVASAWGLYQHRRQLQTNVALEFFKRYEAWHTTAPYVLLDSSVSTRLGDLDEKTRNDVLYSVVRYANICSEEFSLNEAGRVPHDIWKIWEYGIRQNFQNPLWREAWSKKRKEFDSYVAFQKYIDAIVRG